MPEHVVPIRMRGEACHDGLAQLAKVVREGSHFVPRYTGVDEQNTVPALHDNGITLDELALVNENALSDLLQHECLPLVVCNHWSRRYYLAIVARKHYGRSG